MAQGGTPKLDVTTLLHQLGQVILQSVESNQQNAEAFKIMTDKILEANKERNPQEKTIDVLSRSIDTFIPGPSSTFESWYKKHEDVLLKDGESLTEDARRRLLIRKLNQEAYDKFSNIILPFSPQDLSYNETVSKLKSIFCDTESLFQRRYRCFNMEKSRNEDFLSYGARINKSTEEAAIATMNVNQLKCLIFLTGLRTEEPEIKTRLLSLMDDETKSADLTIDKLVAESKRLQTLKADAATLNAFQSSHFVAALTNQKSKSSNKPKTSCWGCGEWHYYKTECPYRDHKCKNCNRKGHTEGMCKSDSIKNANSSKKKHHSYRSSSETRNDNSKHVAITINGHDITLQLDGGSDFTVISEELFHRINPKKFYKSRGTAQSASEHVVKFKYEFPAKILFKGACKEGIIRVSTHPKLNIMGSDFMEKFGLFDIPINSVCLQLKMKDDNLSHVTNFHTRNESKEIIKPKHFQNRQVSHVVKGLVKSELIGSRMNQIKFSTNDQAKPDFKNISTTQQQNDKQNDRFVNNFKGSTNKFKKGKVNKHSKTFHRFNKVSSSHEIGNNRPFHQWHGTRQSNFTIGDLVLAKLYEVNHHKWVPAQVIEEIDYGVYKVRLEQDGEIIRYHVNNLRTKYKKVTNDIIQHNCST